MFDAEPGNVRDAAANSRLKALRKDFMVELCGIPEALSMWKLRAGFASVPRR
jgi:hypothetical protein